MNHLSWNISNDFESKGTNPVEYFLTMHDLIHYMRTTDKIIHPLGIGLYAIDRDTGNYLYVSPHFENITGYTSVEIEKDGMCKWKKMIHPDDRLEILDSIQRESDIILNDYKQPYYVFNLMYRLVSSKGVIKHVCQRASIYRSMSINNNQLEIGMITELNIEKVPLYHQHMHTKIKNEKPTPNIDSTSNDNEQKLSGREKEVEDLLSVGYCSKQISKSLNISVNTVYAHRRKINEKKRTLKNNPGDNKMIIVNR